MQEWAQEIESLMKGKGYATNIVSSEPLIIHGVGPGGGWDVVGIPDTPELADGIRLSLGAAVTLYLYGPPPAKVSIVIPDTPAQRAAVGAISQKALQEFPWLDLWYVKDVEQSRSDAPDAPGPGDAGHGALLGSLLQKLFSLPGKSKTANRKRSEVIRAHGLGVPVSSQASFELACLAEALHVADPLKFSEHVSDIGNLLLQLCDLDRGARKRLLSDQMKAWRTTAPAWAVEPIRQLISRAAAALSPLPSRPRSRKRSKEIKQFRGTGDYEFLETPRIGSLYPLQNRRSKRKW